MFNIQSDNILKYCINHSISESQLMYSIRDYTNSNEKIPQMVCGAQVAGILKMIINLTSCERILEIGTFTGYSSAAMAEEIPESGEIHTCELMEKHANTAKKLWKNSNIENKITVHIGDAILSMEEFQTESFDLIFIDGNKEQYLDYYKKSIYLLKSKGIIILDNMLWSGSVLNPKDNESKILNLCNDYIQNDIRVNNLLIPIRDGLMICQKI
tara:strand:+ start:511 stop:1149 length:639 start_codon:yes stop_codon:yes gene_type:complete